MRLRPLPCSLPAPTSPPNSFFQLQGTLHRRRWVWPPQVPSRKPAPQSLLLGAQGPHVHSEHSLPGPPFFTLSKTHGGQNSGPEASADSLRASILGSRSRNPGGQPRGHRPSFKPQTSHTFLFGHRGGEGQQGEEGEEEEASVLHPAGRARVRAPRVPFPTGGAACMHLPSVFPFSGPKGSSCSRGAGKPEGPTLGR